MTMLELLKAILGIADNTQDAMLTSLLESSQEFIEDYLDRKLNAGEHEDYVESNYQGTIDLKNYPIQSITSIESLDGSQVYSSADFLLIKSTGQVRNRRGFFSGDLQVIYLGGFDPLPAWASKSIVDTACAIYYDIQAGGSNVAMGAIKSEEIYGVAKVMYETGSGASGDDSNREGPIPGSVIDVLNLHRNRHA